MPNICVLLQQENLVKRLFCADLEALGLAASNFLLPNDTTVTKSQAFEQFFPLDGIASPDFSSCRRLGVHQGCGRGCSWWGLLPAGSARGSHIIHTRFKWLLSLHDKTQLAQLLLCGWWCPCSCRVRWWQPLWLCSHMAGAKVQGHGTSVS